MGVLDRFRLDDRTAIVTGGNRGIGRAISEALAEVGANVAIANTDADAGERAATEIEAATGAETLAVRTDVTDEADVAEMVAETVDAFGDVDVLVNNAGVGYHVPAEEMTRAEWERVIDVNLTGVFLCSKHAGRRMIETAGGSIVNVSSMSAFVANYPQEQVAYQASKGGLEAFKLQLASEWAEYGIRVNNVNPGYVATDLIEDTVAAEPEKGEIWREEMLLDEFGTPEDIAPLAVYLASDASSYVTGASITIDGGYTVR